METWNKLVPHPCEVDKNQEGYLRSEESQPQPGLTAQGSSARKISSTTYGCKNQRALRLWKTEVLDSWADPRKEPTKHRLTQTHSL